MTGSAHWDQPPTWDDAAKGLAFRPVQPAYTAGCELRGLRIFIRDHKLRELTVGERSLEAHYGRFVVSQSREGEAEAKRLALEVRYGAKPFDGAIAGHPARLYDLGPVPEPDDIDGRPPSVVTWHDGEMFFLIASGELPVQDLVPIAQSMYPVGPAT